MRPAEKIDESIRNLKLKASADLDKRVHDEISKALAESKKTTSALHEPGVWRIFMKSKITRFAAAAVVALAIVVGMTFWPSRSSDGGKWWLGSPAAWGQEILSALDTVKGVTCREQRVTVFSDGTEEPSRTWDVLYVSQNSYRKDIYDGDFLREIQWYVPDGSGTRQHSVRFDLKSYFSLAGEGSFGDRDPIDRMRFYVGLLGEADRQLGVETIDGRECVGFEISASKYGSNPAEWMDRIWFDVETRLPVRIEQRGRPVTDQPDKTRTIIQNQFDYNPNLAADTFVPRTPEGFVFGHPDDVQAARKNE